MKSDKHDRKSTESKIVFNNLRTIQKLIVYKNKNSNSMQTLIMRQTLLLCAGLRFKIFILWPPIGFFLVKKKKEALFYTTSFLIWISTAIRLNSYHMKTDDPSTSPESTVVCIYIIMSFFFFFVVLISHNELPFLTTLNFKNKNLDEWAPLGGS